MFIKFSSNINHFILCNNIVKPKTAPKVPGLIGFLNTYIYLKIYIYIYKICTVRYPQEGRK